MKSRRHFLAVTAAGAVGVAAGGCTTGSTASDPHARSGTAKRGGATDVLIVGGGSAGATLANRLSASGDRNVVLIEAGPAYAAWDYPKGVSSGDNVGVIPGHDWGYRSEPGYIGMSIATPRGKVLGGCSAVNGAVATRPRPHDFKNWDLPGWTHAELLPAMKRLENSDSGDPGRRGRGGPLPVRQLQRDDVTPMQRAFIDATVANGHRLIEDFDGDDVEGVGPYPMNLVNGVRVNTGMAYLTNDVRSRPNLTVRGGVTVDRVEFDGRRAVGVRLADGEVLRAGEVILSAGTYGSAAILLRSGVGPADELSALAIPVVADLPVGRKLKDHPIYYNAYAARPEAIGEQSPVIGAFLWTRSGLCPGNDLDLHVTATHLLPPEASPTKVGFVLAVSITRPFSVGRFWITTRDPSAAPKIDLNFLADPLDRQRIVAGTRLARKIGATAPMPTVIHSEIAPGPAAQTDAEIEAAIKKTLDTYHHPTSTVPMGVDNDRTAVLDLRCRVRGLRGLSVVDASVFPDTISTATNVTTIATAEHIASKMT